MFNLFDSTIRSLSSKRKHYTYPAIYTFHPLFCFHSCLIYPQYLELLHEIKFHKHYFLKKGRYFYSFISSSNIVQCIKFYSMKFNFFLCYDKLSDFIWFLKPKQNNRGKIMFLVHLKDTCFKNWSNHDVLFGLDNLWMFLKRNCCTKNYSLAYC